MNRLEKIKQEFFERFQNKLKEEQIDLSIESAFDILVSADPSRNKKNVRWLIETYLNDGFLWEDVSSGKHSKVYDTLNTFIRNKTKLDILDRSINRYESIADMWKMVKQYADDKTGHQVKREEYDRAMSESELVVDNDDIRIVVPLTEYASKFHGRGTRWCTAADNNNMFSHYAEEAPLFIITLKESGDKLQLWKNGNNVQFMDEDDSDVTKEYIERHWTILAPLIKDMNELSLIPKQHRTSELCKMAVKRDGCALQYVPDMTSEGLSLKTPELCKLAVQQNGYALKYVPEELKTPELCKMAVEQEGLALRYLPDKCKTPELCKLAVQQNGLALEYVPDMTSNGVALMSLELCEMAVRLNAQSMRNKIPEKFKTYEICKLAVEQNGNLFNKIPEKFQTYEMFKIACSNNIPPFLNDKIPEKYLTEETVKLLCRIPRFAVDSIPEKYITEDICKDIVKYNGYKYVPEKYRTLELFWDAVENIKNSEQYPFSYLPEKYRTEDLILEMLSKNINTFFGLPLKYKTAKICEMAVNLNPLNIIYTPEEHRTQIIYDSVVKKGNGKFLQFVPTNNWTPELIQYVFEHYPNEVKSIPKQKRSLEMQKHIEQQLIDKQKKISSNPSYRIQMDFVRKACNREKDCVIHGMPLKPKI